MDEEHTRETQPRQSGRKKILVAVILLAAVAGGVWLVWGPSEPSYNGKKLSSWLERYEKSRNAESTDAIQSRDAIHHIGTNAIPTLLRMLQAKDSALKLKLVDLIESQHYFHFELPTAEAQNQMAHIGFSSLGEMASNAVPALVDTYKNSSALDIKYEVNSILAAIYPAGGTAIPYWLPERERADWYYEAAHAKAQLLDFSNSIVAFSESLKLDPTKGEAYLQRGFARMQADDFDGALADAKKTLALDSSNQGACYLAGVCEFGLQDFPGAERDLTRAVQLYTNDVSSYNLRGRALAEGTQKEFELALADVSKSIDLNGKDARAFLLRGRIKNSLKEYKAALVDFAKSIELDSKDPSVFVYRAAAELHLNDIESTSADIDTALRLNPKMALAYLMRGILRTKRGEPDAAALADMQRALELSPQSPEVLGVLGLFQYKFSRRTEALENCRKALELKTLANVGELQAFVWIMRAQKGEEPEANRELEAYLKSLPAGKTNEWEASIARFFSGSVTESDFLAQATTTAKRPSAVSGQVCDSYYYAGMKRKLAGDKPGASALFQKCLDTKEEHNYGYINAVVEMRGGK